MFQALFPTIAAWNADYAKPETSSETNQAPDAEATLTARCEAVARRCELSPRETEIFYYLGRGHSSMYISQTLLISDSTVRTHIKNIYRKCGVSSREEILELVDADAQGTEADEAAGRL